jgi:nickel/cobalt transporter (NicO) family protein
MIELILGSLLLSLVHALIPNHWAPVATLARIQGWSLRETMAITLLTGLAHTASTIGLGVLLGLIGFRLTATYQHFASVVAPLVLIGMGLVYVGLGMRHSAPHDHLPKASNLIKRSKTSLILTLCLAMFFSPCLEIETYYLAAGAFGWTGLAVISLIYLLVSVGGMLLLVFLSYRGLQRLNWHWLEHHEKRVTGGALILLGLLGFFLQ